MRSAGFFILPRHFYFQQGKRENSFSLTMSFSLPMLTEQIVLKKTSVFALDNEENIFEPVERKIFAPFQCVSLKP